MRLLDNLRARPPHEGEKRYSGGWNDYVQSVTFQGHQYGLPGMTGSAPHVADDTFRSIVQNVHHKSGVVSAAVFTRSLLLSQVRFAFKPLGDSPIINTQLHGNTPDLQRLERPGAMTRPTMLKRMEQDASYAGNAFLVLGKGRKLHRLPPHKCSFILGSDLMPDWDDKGGILMPYDAEVIGLIFNPNENPNIKSNLSVFLPHEFCHWMPEPDPLHPWRGSSWVTTMLRDVALEQQIDDHQAKFFENAATPSLIFIADPTKTQEETKAYAAAVNQRHAGSQNAHRNMFIGGVNDIRVVGHDFSKIGFKDLEGSIEIATAMRSRIPASILGTRDSLEGSSLNAGNYSAARRMLADGWLHPTVEDLCASLECLATPPDGLMLGADMSHVLFVQEDAQDQAALLQSQMTTISSGVNAGYTPGSVVEATVSGDLRKLVHSGLASVQLQPLGSGGNDKIKKEQEAAAANIAALQRSIETADRSSITNVHNHLEVPEVRVKLDVPEAFRAPEVTVNVPKAETPPPPQVTVNVEPTPVTVNVESAPITVSPAEVTIPPWPAPEVTVNVESPKTKHRVKRNAQGQITEVIEEAK